MLQLDLGRIAMKVGQINKAQLFPLEPNNNPCFFFFLLGEAQ
jgi:hypothetical protein